MELAGFFDAILRWSRHSDRALPAPFWRALERLAESARAGRSRTPLSGGDDEVLARGWCNGSAGLVLLWTEAHASTNDAAYLDLARASARKAATYPRGATGDLCCGLGGRAFALLAMDRAEPGQRWYERAVGSRRSCSSQHAASERVWAEWALHGVSWGGVPH